MAGDSRKQPELFRSNLFSSPSSGLSLGLGGDTFSSPLSLAPALASASTGGDAGAKTTPSATPQSQPAMRGSPSATPPRGSPRAERKAATGGVVSIAELSTVPLDSPTTTAGSDSIQATPEVHRSVSAPMTRLPPGGPGWNDPPVLSHFSPSPQPPARTGTADPSLATNADAYPIQPLAGHLEPTPRTSTNAGIGAPPPSAQYPSPLTNASITTVTASGATPQRPLASSSQQPGGSNPYRMGVGGVRKPAYGMASSGPISQPLVGSGLPSQPLGGGGLPGAVPPQTQTAPLVPPLQQGQPQPPALGIPLQPPPPTLPPTGTGTGPPTQPSQWPAAVGGAGEGPLLHHWFYLRPGERYWIPFSVVDSNRLEETLASSGRGQAQEVLVPTDGGRYDVSLLHRTRQAVYWEEPPSQVRCCSWFYKGEGDRWYLPYQEDVSLRLEEEYLAAVSQGVWNRRVEMTGGDVVILHSSSAMVHYPPSHFQQTVDHEEDYGHPRSVLRGFAEREKVEQGEQSRVDHLVFLVHGIGAHYDLNFRNLVDCVDDFREVAQLMLRTHRFTGQAPRGGDGGGRVEFLPVHWHAALHGENTGVDSRLKPITLPSITRLRDFTNSNLLDILFYTSPAYCQTIMNQVASEMNRMLELFRQRNPTFQGGVSVMGHSLGSCILFDLLDHQGKVSKSATDLEIQQEGSPPETEEEKGADGEGEDEDVPDVPTPTLQESLEQLGLKDFTEVFEREQIDFDSLLMCSVEDLKELLIPLGPRKKLTTYIAQELERQRVEKERRAREAEERLAREKERQKQRELEAAEKNAKLQAVKFVRGTTGTGQPFVEYPQLNFEPEHLFAVGSPIGLFLTVRGVEELGPHFTLPTCPHVFNIFHPFDPVAYRLEPLLCASPPSKAVLMPHHKGRKRFHLELYENLGHMGASIKQHLVEGMRNMWHQLNEIARSHTSSDQAQMDLPQVQEAPPTPVDLEPAIEPVIGRLNQGRRIDHVLQEKPIEKLNEYLFALGSHLCYWRSEDTALFILKEVYQEPKPELIKS